MAVPHQYADGFFYSVIAVTHSGDRTPMSEGSLGVQHRAAPVFNWVLSTLLRS
jgi:hypothetical protein